MMLFQREEVTLRQALNRRAEMPFSVNRPQRWLLFLNGEAGVLFSRGGGKS